MLVSRVIDHCRYLGQKFKDIPYPHEYRVADYGNDTKILKKYYYGDLEVWRFVSRDSVSSDVTKYFSIHHPVLGEHFHMTSRESREAVNYWAQATKKFDPIQTSLVFKSDPNPSYVRLNFDINEDVEDWELECPVFAEMMSRMTNADAFMARIGSIFVPEADRKQVIWLSGPKDCGKSQLDKIIRYLCGYSAKHGDTGAYVSLSSKDLDSPHWKASLVGKRVVSVLEARSSFLNRDSFKSITGDDVHTINEKCKPMYAANIDALMFFYSNEAPHIDSKPEIIERVIDCRIEAIKAENMISGSEVFQAMKYELRGFLSACMAKYNTLCNKHGRIPNDKTTLLEAADEHEEWVDAIFEKYFVIAENHSLRKGEVRDLVLKEPSVNRADKKYRTFLRVLEAKHKITECRVNNIRYLKGFNWKNLGI